MHIAHEKKESELEYNKLKKPDGGEGEEIMQNKSNIKVHVSCALSPSLDVTLSIAF